MTRLDYYDIHPAGMDAYLSNYGYHVSKPMYLWAVSMMRDRNGKKAEPAEKEAVLSFLKSHGVEIEHNMAYDVPMAYMIGKTKFYGSSVADDAHLAKFVKDYLDDKDGSDTRAFDEFIVKTMALGIPIDWQDMI